MPYASSRYSQARGPAQTPFKDPDNAMLTRSLRFLRIGSLCALACALSTPVHAQDPSAPRFSGSGTLSPSEPSSADGRFALQAQWRTAAQQAHAGASASVRGWHRQSRSARSAPRSATTSSGTVSSSAEAEVPGAQILLRKYAGRHSSARKDWLES